MLLPVSYSCLHPEGLQVNIVTVTSDLFTKNFEAIRRRPDYIAITNIHTHTLFFLTLSNSHSLKLSNSQTLKLSNSHSLNLTLTLTLTRYPSFFSLLRAHIHTYTHTHTQIHTHMHTQTHV